MENQESINGVYLVAGLRFHRSVPAFLNAIKNAFLGGIRLFQLRVKDELPDKEYLELAKQVRSLTRHYQVTFIINDRPDIAVLCDADGVHTGPEDLKAEDLRKIVGDKIIGRSSHSYEQAIEALDEPLDYLSVGPVYETDCKKKPDTVVGTELVNEVLNIAEVPIVAIGGITSSNMKPVTETGVSCIGVIRDIMNKSDIKIAAEKFNSTFTKLSMSMRY